MTQHTLQNRSDDEILWFQRRSFLQAAASWSALGGISTAFAQSRSNIVELSGDALLNGRRLLPAQTIQTGDVITTGAQSRLVFVLGNSAFHVRQNSQLTVERGATLSVVSVLRLLQGAVVSVWGKGLHRQITTPTLTAGIRGTGVYTEIFANQDGRSYFCNCYGTVDMSAGGERVLSTSSYHQAFWGEVQAKSGRMLTPAKAINHSDEELEFLARLLDQRTAWQIAGKKGMKDGKGYMQDTPGQPHPAEMLGN
ncbi:MAG: FecR family protein [Gammaproteobacteria bacterium]|uniref:FecR domain-containing protein n=1 Tax=Rhodoferax sp. TaxID=50421 RepID=UPI0017A1E8F7|nr:FecR domain-containing protein [Rhodoferax sp.]MBU3898151.1 FecR family protein [Gammaproteobacteria bacterium]MBA3058568.1 FecR domain-containing protein [Rhodoferax sp.]MBU3999496.1 FecR family protein [Gammaproteobacteria bacterium]MBU4081655.1 FecR family protein [Gammaproteobacteria bacterium]MBU4115244.1 FecR family protein [Gammaproteobacteria bacterium]